VKIHILSDIHLEFGKWPRDVDVNAIDADVTVLAGDIGVGLQGIEWALTFKRPVIYVAGNHEFYGQRPMAELWRKARAKVAGTHVHLLENELLVVNGVRFLGATLWTDFAALGQDRQAECMRYVAGRMTDYGRILVSRRGRVIAEPGHTTVHSGDLLAPRSTLEMHQASQLYLAQELRRPREAWAKTVVVTHNAPSVLSLRRMRVRSQRKSTVPVGATSS
jgi:hypothetical protein